MKNPYNTATKPAVIESEFTAYEVKWECNKGHKNFQTILSLGSQHDTCLKCGAHYEYNVEAPVKKQEVYRVLHKPSGFFYQPHKHRGNNLSKVGKMYSSFAYAKAVLPSDNRGIRLALAENGVPHKALKDSMEFVKSSYAYGQVFADTKLEDWEIVKVN